MISKQSDGAERTTKARNDEGVRKMKDERSTEQEGKAKDRKAIAVQLPTCFGVSLLQVYEVKVEKSEAERESQRDTIVSSPRGASCLLQLTEFIWGNHTVGQ